jgi:hypothetical protein
LQTFNDYYVGWAFRQPPLVAWLMSPLCIAPWPARLAVLYVLEVACAACLVVVALRWRRVQAPSLMPLLPALVLLLGPTAIAQSAAGSIDPLSNALLLAALAAAASGA